ncbi:hypothetical protein AGRO_0657 [Agrobacterium sp. ATCC 31749]|nr:hypothetical protein AGRO_0657 [Agrobacterium sp. ATCC 31749]
MTKNADFLRFFSGLTKAVEYNRFNPHQRGRIDTSGRRACGKPRSLLSPHSCS